MQAKLFSKVYMSAQKGNELSKNMTALTASMNFKSWIFFSFSFSSFSQQFDCLSFLNVHHNLYTSEASKLNISSASQVANNLNV